MPVLAADDRGVTPDARGGRSSGRGAAIGLENGGNCRPAGRELADHSAAGEGMPQAATVDDAADERLTVADEQPIKPAVIVLPR